MNNQALPVAPSAGGGDALLQSHATLVARIAHHLKGRLPETVEVDDLIQAGMIGLIEAARNYDTSHGASFETYAGIRVRGAMIDEVRRSDWAPRSVHRKIRAVSDAISQVEAEQGRDARDHEVARKMGISLDEYHRTLKDVNGHRVMALEDAGIGDDLMDEGMMDRKADPLLALQQQDMKRAVTEAISALPERERLVLALYYDEELNLREIGEVLGVSESRVCQIHGQAVARLRARLNRD